MYAHSTEFGCAHRLRENIEGTILSLIILRGLQSPNDQQRTDPQVKAKP